MVYKKLGSTDLTVSRISLGCVTFGREIDRSESFSILNHATSRGINFFDTAEAYGEGASEAIIGQWMEQYGKRSEISIGSKIKPPYTAERITKNCEESLRRLKIDELDLYQLHEYHATAIQDEALHAFDNLVTSGKVRYVGVSNFSMSQLDECLTLQGKMNVRRFQSVQNNHNLAVKHFDTDYRDYCETREIGMISYSPLGAGFLTGKYDNRVPQGARFDIRPAHQNVYFTDQGREARRRLESAASSVGVDVIRLALSYVLHLPRIDTTLVGARRPSHIDQAVDAWEWDDRGTRDLLESG